MHVFPQLVEQFDEHEVLHPPQIVEQLFEHDSVHPPMHEDVHSDPHELPHELQPEHASLVDDSVYKPFKETEYYKFLSIQTESLNEPKKLKIKKYFGCLTPLGENFFEVCVQ